MGRISRAPERDPEGRVRSRTRRHEPRARAGCGRNRAKPLIWRTYDESPGPCGPGLSVNWLSASSSRFFVWLPVRNPPNKHSLFWRGVRPLCCNGLRSSRPARWRGNRTYRIRNLALWVNTVCVNQRWRFGKAAFRFTPERAQPGKPDARLELTVTFRGGRKHLPIVTIRRVA